MTRSATELVGPRTFSSLTRHVVAVDPFADPTPPEIEHITWAEAADAIVIAPATANTIAKLAAGICDDMLTTTVCASRAPVVIAPAMNPTMWEHAATRRNVETLVGDGCVIVAPGEGEVACGHIGRGRLAQLPEILAAVERALAPKPLAGRRLLITAGPTREAIDPIRYLTNRSSGKMGFALAQEAWFLGAEVCCVAGPAEAEPPAGPEVVSVESAREMHDAVLARLAGCDAYVGVAAVADFTPPAAAASKLKKAGREGLTLELTRTDDILGEVCASPSRPPLVVGFAAETELVEERGAEKLVRKGCDLLVANRVGPGGVMGSSESQALLLGPDGYRREMSGPKHEVARVVLEAVAERLAAASAANA
jgi:phosphopantothenoylcysteine decarboxylase / phosphopantothenate---cysteine ligase